LRDITPDEEIPSIAGAQVRVLLHVEKGMLAELEVYKDDGSPTKIGPLAERLILQ
jgi:hypothetical protein